MSDHFNFFLNNNINCLSYVITLIIIQCKHMICLNNKFDINKVRKFDIKERE